jgi:hypothetical protein
MPDSRDPLPSVDDLQFHRAEPVNKGEEAPSAQICAACKLPLQDQYFKVQNNVICPACAAKIESGRQAPKPIPWARAILFGSGAALAGCILYAIVLMMGVQIGIVALLVGYMVGKAIRSATYGVGGRPQQILAVALTYFAISTSFVPAMVVQGAKQARNRSKTAPSAAPVQPAKPQISPGKAIVGVVVLITISPFLELFGSPVGGLISLFILFIGLQRAWALTARHDILVTGPYACPTPS